MNEALRGKVTAVMAAVTSVAKTGKNQSQNYKYAKDEDIVAAVRAAMIDQGLVLIPNVRQMDWRDIQGKDKAIPVCVLTVEFTITDGKDSHAFLIVGSGMDSGDKGPYKAMTGAEKYALLKLFLIPTGDDPEKDDKPQRPPRDNTVRPDAPSTISKEQQKAVFATASAIFPPEEIKARVKDALGKFGWKGTAEILSERLPEFLTALQEAK